MSSVLGEEQEMKIDSFNQPVKEADQKVLENIKTEDVRFQARTCKKRGKKSNRK